MNATQEAPVLQTPDPLLGRLLDAAIEAIGTNAERLGDLDRAIGDGDHGLNMLRGFAALAAQRDALAALPLGAALESAGNLLVMNVGGASGPLYGSLLIAMGKAAARDDASVLVVLDEGVAAVKRRGKSDRGEKTMLDVLAPVLEEEGDERVLERLIVVRKGEAGDNRLGWLGGLRSLRRRSRAFGRNCIGEVDQA